MLWNNVSERKQVVGDVGYLPATEDMLKIWPEFLATMPGVIARNIATKPLTLVSIIVTRSYIDRSGLDSASFSAEISVRSPRKLIIYII